MVEKELELEREINIEYLNDILKAWRSPDRRLRKLFVLIVIVAVIAVYFTASDWFGMTWGYIATIVVLFAAFFCADQLGLSFKAKIWPDGKFAYQACVTMEILIAIKKGTYREYGAHILTTGTGKHHDLYRKFIQMYPEYKCRDLEKMSKISVALKDKNN